MYAIEIDISTQENKLTLAKLPKPIPNAQQVLIKVIAAGINRPDILQRQGLYPPPAGASTILGLELAGVVVEIGSLVKNFNIGDPVCALVTGGAYAEYCLADPACCLLIPKNLSFTQAAALPEALFTVWSNVFERGYLQKGESLLVHGGGSGIGTTVLQLATLLGSQVFVTAGSDEKCQKCLALGADAAINYNEADFVTAIQELTAGKGVNVLLDMVGGDYLPRNLKCLAEEGRLLQIAVQNGVKSEINLWTLMSRRLLITGSTLRARDTAFKAHIAWQLQEKVWPLLESGKMRPVLAKVFSLANAQLAHDYMLSNQHFGKIILEVEHGI